MDNRKQMGKNKDGVIVPVAPNLSEMSDAYLKFIKETLQVIDCNIGIVKYTIKMGKILS